MTQTITVVMYHYVRDLPNTKYPEIKGLLTNDFKGQLDYLKKYYTFITIEDCISRIHYDCELPANACLLTFDDGYIDHYMTVFPILNEKKIQGSFFPPAKAILYDEVLDVNKIHFILAFSYNKIDKLLKDIYSCLDKYRLKYNLKNNSYYYSKLAIKDRFDVAEVIFVKRLLQVELEGKLRKLIVDELFKNYVTKDEKSFSRELYMDLDQIKCMVRNGMYVGSHGFNHSWLNMLQYDEQENEIDQSLRFLNLVNAPTKNWVMCYPYGLYNDSLIEIIKKKGCSLAFTTKVDLSNLTKKNAYTLERLDTTDLPYTLNSRVSAWTKKQNINN